MTSVFSRLHVSRPAVLCQNRLVNRTQPIRYGLTSTFLQPFTARNLTTEFSGLTLKSTVSRPSEKRTGSFVVEANAKNSLGARTGVGTKRKRRRVSGFRTRMRSPGGRRVLKRRRVKGRKVLCPASVRRAKDR